MNSLVLAGLHGWLRHAPGQHRRARLADYLDRQLQLRPRAATARTTFSARIPVHTSDIIQRYLYLFGVWEPHLTAWISRRLRPGDVFVDVGANIGYYSLLAAHLTGPAGHVVAIDPSPDFCQRLTAAARTNRYNTIRVVTTAVADATGPRTFYLEAASNLGGTTSVRPRGPIAATFDAPAAPLPAVLTDYELTHARIIKIDVEGAEAAVIRGLAGHLPQLHPDAELVIEITPRSLAKQQLTPADVIDPLLAGGFHPYRLDNDYAAASYPAARRTPAPPRRHRGPVTDMIDMVFSRIEAEELP